MVSKAIAEDRARGTVRAEIWAGAVRDEEEQEDERNPQRCVCGARRVCDALRTHEEMVRMLLAN